MSYWNDILTVNATVSTGKFDVIFDVIAHGDYDNFSSEGNAFSEDYEEDYVNGKGNGTFVQVSSDYKSLTFANTNLYPGSGVWLTFKVKNNGTIPAIVESVEEIINAGEELKDEFRYTIGDITLYQNANGRNTKLRKIYDEQSFDEYKDFIEALNNSLRGIVLQPGEFLEVGNSGNVINTGLDIYLREDVGNFTKNDHKTQGEDFSFTLKLNYTQHNKPIE